MKLEQGTVMILDYSSDPMWLLDNMFLEVMDKFTMSTINSKLFYCYWHRYSFLDGQ